MKRTKILLINAIFWLLCTQAKDYTLAVIVALYSLPELFRRTNKRRVKYE